MNTEYLIGLADKGCCATTCDKCPVERDDRGRKLCETYSFDNMPQDDLEYVVKLFENDISNEKPFDIVEKAEHYNQGGIECIEAIEASMSPEEYAGFLKGQVIKYVWRYRHKCKPVEDLKKARYYLDELIEKTEDPA